MNKLTEPKIGYYYSECCLLDLYKIENEEDLEMVKERIKDNDEFGELMIFASEQDAIDYLTSADHHQPEH